MASKDKKLIKVLIKFKQKKGKAKWKLGKSEKSLVRAKKGKIKHTYHLIPVIAASMTEANIKTLKKNPDIESIEPDGKVHIVDAELDNTWGVKRIGAGLVHDKDNKGTGIKIAIIDSGIDYNHPDLAANYKGGYDFVNNDDDPMDDCGHGTHVAGTVAALDNDVGVVGVAPEAHLYALKVLDADGYGWWSDVIAALQWCVDNGMQITNNSYASISGTEALKNAFDTAYASGILNVAAAGNEYGGPVTYPAKYDSLIAVSATDDEDELASFSSIGPEVELAAPGVGINSAKLGGGYIEKQGTSMACPHVVGTAALVWISYPAWSNVEVREQLKVTAEDLGKEGWDNRFGWGLIDAYNATIIIITKETSSAYLIISLISGDLSEEKMFKEDGKGEILFRMALLAKIRKIDNSFISGEESILSLELEV